MEGKIKVSQDTLYRYLLDHNVKVIRFAELMGTTESYIHLCFKHQGGRGTYVRTFSAPMIAKLNGAMLQVANELRGCVLTFGSDKTYTNSHGRTYDPGLIEPMKHVGDFLMLTGLTQRILGWSESKKENVLVTKTSKAYGNISREDVDRINAELLSVAAVLESYEVVPGLESAPANS